MNRKEKLQATKESIVLALDDVHQRHFTPEMLLTFVARHPTNKDCFMLISDDDELVDFLNSHLQPKGESQ